MTNGFRTPAGGARFFRRARAILCGAASVAALLLLFGTWNGTGCGSPPSSRSQVSTEDGVFLDSLAARTFRYFWELSDPRTGLTPDRAPTRSFVSIAATGFALSAYPIGVERGLVTRDAARERVLATFRFLWNAPQGTAASGCIGHKGFFYHFLDPQTGNRFETVELSTQDTALLLAGVLFCQSYFDKNDAGEKSIRSLAESLYARSDWNWMQVRPPAVAHGWTPEEGFLPYDWGGYNEAMLLYILALGSPAHPVGPEAWAKWTSTYKWGTFQGYEHVGFAPLFGHQYTHAWIDFRGIQDAPMREHGIDYFENARRATYAQQKYAIENPMGWSGYGAQLWGLTACDGPLDQTLEIEGRKREFHTYDARGASFTHVQDDGTISPSAAGGSIAFAPEIVIPTLRFMRDTYGEHLYSRYGFMDAFNPTLRLPIETHHGRVVPTLGWFDTDYLGIDEGPILLMLANYESELVWRTMRRNPHIVRGLRAAGFRGGWLGQD